MYELVVYLVLLQTPLGPGLEEPGYQEEVIVTATRSGRRVEDEPLRVEVVPAEEVQEKIMMTPGDVSMLLNETNGLRVQTTSPSLGGANVRIQGLRGRYTQVLADGLPLYGGQTGSIGLLQIPPMDLAQVEVIKGVASALYGVSAIGGVVNLVSRRPQNEPEREVLINGTSHAGADGILWLSQRLNPRWGVTFLGGLHAQGRSDLDEDGWTDLPMYRRVIARPRLFWEDGGGRSALLAFGVTGEDRRGGTPAGALAPDGRLHGESLDTLRIDAGGVGRFLTGGDRVLTVRGSATSQSHDHQFGTALERDVHRTLFGEVSLTGSSGAHTWVAGAALQYDAYASDDVPRFDFRYAAPGVFAQDELRAASWLTLAASGRVDVHSEHGTFVSPRLSALLRSGGPWTTRVSVGRGYFAPAPFTEETEATGLHVLAPLGDVEPERADSASGDLTWARPPFEVTGTVFYSRVRDALQVRATEGSDFPIEIVNAGPVRTRGTELIARLHQDEPELDVILTHMYLWSTESDPALPGTRREVPLNPRHAASLDILSEIGPARIGVEVFYTGRQALDENPYRTTGAPYVLWGALLDWNFGRARAFVNAENLGDVRQTKGDPLLRRVRERDGRWTVDAWAPLEGRTVNAGIRIGF